MSKFINRRKELETLRKEYNRKEASFVVIYGRRRVGKTSLIKEFCKDKRKIMFLATEESENENRTAFKETVAEALDDSLLREAQINRWETIFERIAKECESSKNRMILVMDEFQYLGKANPAFPSILMKIWDEKLKEQNIMLILCGSLIHMMTSQVLNYDSPLYGRRTAQIKLQQIGFEHYKEFMPEESEDSQILHYAVTGGVPKYIELFQQTEDIYEGIKDNILSDTSFLYEEPTFLLQKEVTEIGSYFTLLKTIAAGNHKLGKMAAVMEVKQTNLSKYLKTLMELDLVEREVPITEENPEKSKKGLYIIKDNFIKFWFQFVYPNKGLLEAGREEFVYEKIKKNFIDNHVSYVYENICREKLWSEQKLSHISFNRVGRFWGNQDVEIDIVAYDSFGNDMILGECKYSVNPKGVDVLYSLEQKSIYVDWKKDNRKEYYCIFSRSGFTKELLELAQKRENVILLS